MIVGQNRMLERLLVALLASGHVLLERVAMPRIDLAHGEKRARR